MRADIAVAYVWTIPFLILMLLRILFHDVHMYLIWGNMYLLWVYLPVYPVLIASLFYKEYPLIALSGFPVLLHLYFVLPDFLPSKDQQISLTRDPNFPPLKVFSANLLMVNYQTDGIMNEMIKYDPDVIVQFSLDLACVTVSVLEVECLEGARGRDLFVCICLLGFSVLCYFVVLLTCWWAVCCSLCCDIPITIVGVVLTC